MIDTQAVKAAVERYTIERDSYDLIAKSVGGSIMSLLDERNLQCTVSGRAKDLRSFHKKIVEKRYEDPWLDVTDKAGVRVVVQLARDVDSVAQCLTEHFGDLVLEVDDKRRVTDPATLNYSGIHLQLYFASSLKDKEQLQCEVQVRTIAQDAWSVVSHKLLYKPFLELPPKIQHAGYRLVALVELFDEEVTRLYDLRGHAAGADLEPLIDAAEAHYLELAHSPSDRRVSVIFVDAIRAAFSSDEIANYSLILDAFVDAERDRLEQLFAQYGPHSAVSYVSDYILFNQAESLILLERLSCARHSVTAVWEESGMPMSYLQSLANAAGVALPETLGG